MYTFENKDIDDDICLGVQTPTYTVPAVVENAVSTNEVLSVSTTSGEINSKFAEHTVGTPTDWSLAQNSIFSTTVAIAVAN